MCHRDKAVYESPHINDLERFLKDGKFDSPIKDPEERIFGAGRRFIHTLGCSRDRI